jgi:cytochrome P450
MTVREYFWRGTAREKTLSSRPPLRDTSAVIDCKFIVLTRTLGPIVRINPEELHCNDPEFTDEIYAGGNRVRDKQQHHVNSVAGPVSTSTFATVDHELHRIRRSAASRFFSRVQMLKFENEIACIVNQLCDKLLSWTNKSPFDINDAYACFTADAISQYAYGEPTGYLAQPEWTPNFRDSVRALGGSCFVLRFMPVFRNLVDFAPYLARYMTDEIAMFMNETAEILPRRIKEVKENRSKGRMFSELLDSNLPESEKSVYRLSGEAFSLIGAGTETTAVS